MAIRRYRGRRQRERPALFAYRVCQGVGLEPYAYLRHVVTELPKVQSLAEVEALLPTGLDPAALARDSLQESYPAARQ